VYGFELQMPPVDFFILVMTVVLITAGGYIINDYFDRKTDLLNHPDTVIVGKVISRRLAMFLHLLFNGLALLGGAYISYKIHYPLLTIIFLSVEGLLWFYSTTYKRQLLLGNIIVSFLTAVVPFMVVVFEIPLLNQYYAVSIIKNNLDLSILFKWVGGFSVFAFLINLLREIIKDAEDFEGDIAYGRNSVPIVWGIKVTKAIVLFLIASIISGVFYIYINHLMFDVLGRFEWLTTLYLIVFLIIPLIALISLVIHANKKEDYHKCSQLSKLIMITGVLYAVLFRVHVIQNIF
jgi:4-hydroxybenzoate polyprenyltransferase